MDEATTLDTTLEVTGVATLLAGTTDARVHSASAGTAHVHQFKRTKGGNYAGRAAVANADVLGTIAFQGYVATDDYETSAKIIAKVEETGTIGNNVLGGKLVFQTATEGGVTLVDRLTISSAGVVTIAGDLIVNGGDITHGKRYKETRDRKSCAKLY